MCKKVLYIYTYIYIFKTATRSMVNQHFTVAWESKYDVRKPETCENPKNITDEAILCTLLSEEKIYFFVQHLTIVIATRNKFIMTTKKRIFSFSFSIKSIYIFKKVLLKTMEHSLFIIFNWNFSSLLVFWGVLCRDPHSKGIIPYLLSKCFQPYWIPTQEN